MGDGGAGVAEAAIVVGIAAAAGWVSMAVDMQSSLLLFDFARAFAGSEGTVNCCCLSGQVCGFDVLGWMMRFFFFFLLFSFLFLERVVD